MCTEEGSLQFVKINAAEFMGLDENIDADVDTETDTVHTHGYKCGHGYGYT